MTGAVRRWALIAASTALAAVVVGPFVLLIVVGGLLAIAAIVEQLLRGVL